VGANAPLAAERSSFPSKQKRHAVASRSHFTLEVKNCIRTL
jgi:hypothetical protein